MGSKVEKIEVALAQNIPFEDEVVELAPKFISAETPEKAPTASGRGGGDSATPSGPAASVEVDFSLVLRLNQMESPAAMPLDWKRGASRLHEVSLEFADLDEWCRVGWSASMRARGLHWGPAKACLPRRDLLHLENGCRRRAGLEEAYKAPRRRHTVEAARVSLGGRESEHGHLSTIDKYHA